MYGVVYMFKCIAGNRIFLCAFIMSLLLFFGAGCEVLAQEQKITLNIEQASLPAIFQQIESETGYKFSYKDQIFNSNQQFSIHEKEQKLESVLGKLLTPLDLDFFIFKDKVILILEKKSKGNVLDSITVSGWVTDESGVPLPGANVRIKDDKDLGTVSDPSGYFTLKHIAQEKKMHLLVTYIGFFPQEIPLSLQKTVSLTIKMYEDDNKLDEVVVIGYGTVKKSNLTGAVSSLKGDVVPTAASANIYSRLQGRIAGFNVTQTSAIPGGAFDFSIRGKASTGAGNEPLVVIDGFPMQSFKDLEIVNSNDIETIEVLKDASATAIYGARAANGVLLVNTRKGGQGAAQVTVRSNISVQTLSSPLKMMKARELMEATNSFYYEDYLYQNRKGVYAGLGNAPVEEVPLRVEYTSEEIAQARDITDWMGEITRNGVIFDNHVSIRGGEKLRYHVSLSSFNQKGVLITSDYAKYSGYTSLEINLSEKIKTGLNLALSQANVSNPELSQSSDYAGIIRDASAYPTFYPIYNEDGSYFINPKHPQYPNPVSWKDVHNISEETRIMIGNYWSVSPVHNWDIRLSWGTNMLFQRKEKQYPKSHLLGEVTNTQATIEEFRNNQYLLDLTTTYQRELFEGHLLKLMVGYAYQKFQNKYLFAQGKGYVSDAFGINKLETGDPALNEIGSSKRISKYISYFVRLNYDINDKYLASFTLRADGSDKFGSNNKYGYFPSVALAWRISEEKFLQEKKNWLSELKIRFSLGRTGNANIGGSAYAELSADANYIFNNRLTTGVRPTQLGNPDLKWETTTEVNCGMDFSVLRNRLSGSIDVYQKVVSDLLDKRSVGSMYPVSTVYDNLGKTQSRGIEIQLNTINILKPDFCWQSNFTYTAYKDKWKERNPYTILSSYNTNTDPLHIRWGYKSDGLIQEGDVLPHMPGAPVGTIKVLDLNGWAKDEAGNFILDKQGRQVITEGPDGKLDDADKVIISKSVPDFTFGINNTISYKGFDLSVYLTGEMGRSRWNETLLADLTADKFRFGDNVSVYAHQMWRSNKEGKYPSGVFTTYDADTDFWVEKCNFIRLKSLVFGYQVPANLLGRIGFLKKLRFFWEGQNLFLLTSYTSGDPETDRYMAYFNQRTFTFGVVAEF